MTSHPLLRYDIGRLVIAAIRGSKDVGGMPCDTLKKLVRQLDAARDFGAHSMVQTLREDIHFHERSCPECRAQTQCLVIDRMLEILRLARLDENRTVEFIAINDIRRHRQNCILCVSRADELVDDT